MASWIGRARGWQRLWLAGTALCLAVGVLVLPSTLERQRLESLAAERARVIADFDRPECLPVRATPYTQLAPIPEGAPCRDVYVWRKNVTEKLPLVLDHVLFPMDAHRREIWFAGALKGAALAAFISAVLYGVLSLAARRKPG